MPTIRFQVFTDLPPDRVLQALIDFSDQRPIVWPKIDRSHFRVHGEGPNWAEVTEGNALAWERNRYEWNAGAGEVTVTAVESDTWAPGSQWRYRLLSTATGGTGGRRRPRGGRRRARSTRASVAAAPRTPGRAARRSARPTP